MKNDLTKISFVIAKDQLDNDCLADNLVIKMKKLLNYNKLYSYIVYNKLDKSLNKNNDCWKIVCYISNISEFNCLNTNLEICNIALSIIKDNLSNNVVCFKQPKCEIIIQVFEPLIKKLCYNFYKSWNQLEYDDIYQTCIYTLIKLHKFNYYLHKNLIIKACSNEILHLVMPFKKAPIILSIDEPIQTNGKSLNFEELITDESDLIEQEQLFNDDYWNSIFKEMKTIIVEKLGQRRFDRLFNCYGKNQYNNAASHDLSLIKKYLKEEELDKDSFSRYL